VGLHRTKLPAADHERVIALAGRPWTGTASPEFNGYYNVSSLPECNSCVSVAINITGKRALCLNSTCGNTSLTAIAAGYREMKDFMWPMASLRGEACSSSSSSTWALACHCA